MQPELTEDDVKERKTLRNNARRKREPQAKRVRRNLLKSLRRIKNDRPEANV